MIGVLEGKMCRRLGNSTG